MEYKIKTVKDLFDKIPADKIDQCIDELKKLIVQTQFVRDLSSTMAPSMGLKGAIEFPDEVTWVDDSKGEVTMNIHTVFGDEKIHTATFKTAPVK